MTCSGAVIASTAPPQGTRLCRSNSAPPLTASVTAWSARPTAPTSPAVPATARTPPPDPFFALVFDFKRAGLQQAGQPRPRRSPRRVSRAAALRRLADVLRPRRRAGQEQQEDRHHHFQRAVHPTATRDRAPYPNRAGRPSAAQPAPAADLGTALRAEGRRRNERSGPRPRRTRRDQRPVRPIRQEHTLWYYILAEAKATTDGVNLGPVGGRIVAETLIGLLRADRTSYLNLNPRFQPFLGTELKLGPTPNPNITGNRAYTRAHFLHYAGVLTPGIYR